MRLHIQPSHLVRTRVRCTASYKRHLLLCAVPLLLLVAGCMTTVDVATVDPPEPAVATFVARDYGFEGPDVIRGGRTVVRIVNDGQEPHHIQLVKLSEGKTPADLQAALLHGPHVEIPSWAKQMGGPNGVMAGRQAEVTLNLEPGSYVLLCVIPTKQGTPHVALGMHKAMRVIEHHPSASSFSAEYHMAMADFEFAVLEPMKSGTHTFHVINRGTQPHEVSIVRLSPDATPKVTGFRRDTGDAIPGKLIGGMAGLEPGGEGVFTVALEPGRYGMICLFPNPNGPMSHASKGMVMNFTLE